VDFRTVVDLRAARFLILLGLSQGSAVKLKEVQYFLAVCEEGTFTGAARRCGVSQPSLSNAIQRLERKLGGLLFHRAPSPVRLTELGRTLLPSFKEFDECAASIYRNAARLSRADEVEVSRMAHHDISV
jgi:DNA-binding transcriptional LysR family regulator